MNVRKRGLALLMCICMIFTLLPFSALADATAQDDGIVYGKYDDTGWHEDKTLTAENSVKHYPAFGETSDNKANIDYSKTAVKNNDGTYSVTLTIKSTTKETPPGASAVVLVIDSSGSMKNGRLDSAKSVAKEFIDKYGSSGSDRYLAVVNFDTYANAFEFGSRDNKTNWLDVSNADNRKNVKSSFKNLYPGGGTNLEQGLVTANALLGKLNNVSNDNKFVIVLTDGEPTFYSNNKNWDLFQYVPEGNGSSCDEATYNATLTAASSIKSNAKYIYTVCYGAEFETVDYSKETVGDFLANHIASTDKAYNAKDDDNSLSEAFAKIYESIKHGISSGFTVTDPMGKYVNLDSASLNGNGYSVSGSTITWEPQNGTTETNTDGSKTTTYTLTYKVTLGEVPKDDTYPLNENTTLKFKDGKNADGSDNEVTRQFNVPGVYREATKYTVTYQYTGEVPNGAQEKLPSDNTQYKKDDPVTVKPAPTLDGWTFDGWYLDGKKINGTTFEMPGENVTLTGSWTQDEYTITYLSGANGKFILNEQTTLKIDYDGNHYGDPTPAAPTTDGNSQSGTIVPDEGYYFTGWEPERAATVTGNAEYTAQYAKKNEITVIANSDTKTYTGEKQSISGFKTLSFTIDDKTYTVSGLDARVSGIDANTYTNEVTGTAVVKDDNGNDVTGQFTVKTQNGTLTIKQATVTITADNQEKYVGANDPKLTYKVKGIVEADKDKNLSVTLEREKYGTEDGELVGNYDITPSNASIEGSNNYTFRYEKGTLTIKDRAAKKITLTATKLMDGEDATGSDFKFELYQIVGGEEMHIDYANNNGKTITFTREAHSTGEYIYYIREVAGAKTSINYDETVYAAKVTVTNDDAAGSYSYTVQYYKVVDGKEFVEANGNAAVFNNTTKPGDLVVSKAVAGNAAIKTQKFLFAITLTNDEAQENAAGKTLTVPFNPDQNYVILYSGIEKYMTDGKLTIKVELKADQKITIRGLPDGISYTVQELDNNGYTVSATVNGQTATLKDNMLVGTIAAGAETMVVFKNTKNYVYPPNPPIMDEITVEITGNSDSVVYDGAEHSVKGYTVKISDPRYTEADFTFTGKAEASGVNAGTYEMGLKAEQFKNTNARFTNVKFVIKADGVLTITPKELIITAGSKTEYGPTPVTCGEWTVSGLAAGDKVESVKITGIQSVPGSSPNVPSDAVIKNAKGEDVTKNYAIKYVNGTLTMLEVLNKEDHFNYIIGTPEGLSLPTANVTRAEVATIFFRLMTDDARAKFDSLDNSFSDVAKGKWYNRAISTLANAGIIKGDPAGTYRPGDPITRAEMAAIIARFGDFKEGGKTFSDISGHWAQKYIELAASNGWINGNPDGTFKPNNNITRAETVAMINRVLNRQTESNDDLLPVSQMTNWSDNMDTAKWYYRDMQEATNNHKAERVGTSMYEKWTEKLPDIDWASYQI